MKVDLIDGSYHEVDSSEMAFKIAGSIAFREAAKRATRSAGTSRGRGSGRARGIHGRRHRRYELVAAAISRAWSPGRERRSSRRLCRWHRCSATPPISAPCRRDGPSTPCSSVTTPRCPAARAGDNRPAGRQSPNLVTNRGRRTKRDRLPGCGGRLSDSGRKEGQWLSRSSHGPSLTSMWARSGTWTTARPP